jgi:hypothetical protein
MDNPVKEATLGTRHKQNKKANAENSKYEQYGPQHENRG